MPGIVALSWSPSLPATFFAIAGSTFVRASTKKLPYRDPHHNKAHAPAAGEAAITVQTHAKGFFDGANIGKPDERDIERDDEIVLTGAEAQEYWKKNREKVTPWIPAPGSLDETRPRLRTPSEGIKRLAEVGIVDSPEAVPKTYSEEQDERKMSTRRRAWEVERGMVFEQLPDNARLAHPRKHVTRSRSKALAGSGNTQCRMVGHEIGPLRLFTMCCLLIVELVGLRLSWNWDDCTLAAQRFSS